MGRLIDADKLIILAENTFARPNGFIRLIEETETAYNVDAVLADIDELWKQDIFSKSQLLYIVKRGGVEL